MRAQEAVDICTPIRIAATEAYLKGIFVRIHNAASSGLVKSECRGISESVDMEQLYETLRDLDYEVRYSLDERWFEIRW